MSILRQAAQQALEALEGLADYRYTDRVKNTMASLRQAIAEPEQEPVLYINPRVINPATGKVRTRTGALTFSDEPCAGWSLPLYTEPTPRKPLTDEEIWNTYKNLWMFHPAEEPRLAGDVLKFARAIERHHGIGDSNG
jgi:hypothetical protein